MQVGVNVNSWLPLWVFFSRRLIDGTHARGLLMSRRTPAGWEYRKMTEAEIAEHIKDDAW